MMKERLSVDQMVINLDQNYYEKNYKQGKDRYGVIMLLCDRD